MALHHSLRAAVVANRRRSKFGPTSLRFGAVALAALTLGVLFGGASGRSATLGDQGSRSGLGPKAARTAAGREHRSAASRTSPVLAAADFSLVGIDVRPYPTSLPVPKNTPTHINTTLNAPEGTDVEQLLSTVDPNYHVRGVLTGPSFSQPVVVEAPIGQPLPIPGLSRGGLHQLHSMHVVDAGNGGAEVGSVTPDLVSIEVVEQLLVSEVDVRELTYNEIVESGINVTDDSYQYFNFSFALGTLSDAQHFTVPVAMPRVGSGVSVPIVGPPRPPVGVHPPTVDLPEVVPVILNVGGGGDPLDLPGNVPIRLPGAIVFPGRIGILHQFFEAIVIVGNGAPTGSPTVLTVRNLHAMVELPDNGTVDTGDDPLRVAEQQEGGQVTDLEIRGLGPDGTYNTNDDTSVFRPGESGQARFLLEGLKEGLHRVNFKLDGTLDGLPNGPVPITGEVPGAVLVRDAQFAVTFTHPSVVRAGQVYDFSMTMYNSSPSGRTIQHAEIGLNQLSMSGAQFADPLDVGDREVGPLAPGESETVHWRMRATVTGAVTSSYVKVGQDVDAGIALTVGVGDRNVPLSPDSLILPTSVEYLPEEVAVAATALLGQAWSVATAPAEALPPGVLPITRQTVHDHAADLAVAGQRVHFGESVEVSLGTLVRDWLDEVHDTPEPGFVDALRETTAGDAFFDAVGSALRTRILSGQPAIDGVEWHREFVESEASRSAMASAVLTQADGPGVAGVRLIDPSNNAVGFVSSATDRRGQLQTGASMVLGDAASGNTSGQMVVATHVTNLDWTVDVTGWATGQATLSLALPSQGGIYRHAVFTNIPVVAGDRYRVVFRPFGTGQLVLQHYQNGGFEPSGITGSVSEISDAAPRLVKAMQVSPEVWEGGDKWGRVIGLFFSKPLDTTRAASASRYSIGGGAVHETGEQVGRPIAVLDANAAYGGRFVFIALSSPVGPYIDRDVTLSGLTDAAGRALQPATNVPIAMTVSAQGDPSAGYVTGRVLTADGASVAGASVYYEAFLKSSFDVIDSVTLTVVTTDSNGRFALDYVRNGDFGPAQFTAINPTTHARKKVSLYVTGSGRHMLIDMVFIARGAVQGTVTANGAPAAGAYVHVVSTLEPGDARVVQTDAQGRYFAEDVTVGSVSVRAVGVGALSSASGIASGTIEGPGQTATVNVTLQNTGGRVSGTAYRPGPSLTPAAGELVVAEAAIAGFGTVPVGYAFTNQDGTFEIDNLPLCSTCSVTLKVGGSALATVAVTNDEPEVDNIVLVLPGYGAVSGRVIDETGSYIGNVPVWTSQYATVADAFGNFVLPSVPVGNQTIHADLSTELRGSTTVTVRAGETVENVSIVIARPSTFTGTVKINVNGTLTPVKGAYVTVDGTNIAQTNAQGVYSLGNVAPNRQYTMRFVHPNLKYAVNFPVVVGYGETIIKNATFRSGSLRGTVYQPDGQTTAVATVSVNVAYPNLTPGYEFGLLSSKSIPITTAGDGQYSVDQLNIATYRVTATSAFYPTRVNGGGTIAANEESVCNLTLVSLLAGKVQGTVYAPDGQPAGAGIAVTLGGPKLGDVTVHTDGAGHYEFAEVFTQGNYDLTAFDEDNAYLKRMRVALRANKDGVFDLRLTGRGGLHVRVLDGGGVPIQGGSVKVTGTTYPNQKEFAAVPADANGYVTFTNLAEGDYAVEGTQTNGLAGRVNVRVTTGATTEATIATQASAPVEGRVKMPVTGAGVGLADVHLKVSGRPVAVSVTSDVEGEEGKFRFEEVPAGAFTIEVFDNRTGRVGRTAGAVTAQNQLVTADAFLLRLGTVRGTVSLNNAAVDHALVTLTAGDSGFNRLTLQATTDTDGSYVFTGIPEGVFQVSVRAPNGKTGVATGELAGAGDPVPDQVIDVVLASSVTVQGTVREADGTTVVVGARVTVLIGNQKFTATSDANGMYQVNWAPLGTVLVRATAPAGFNRGQTDQITADTPGQIVTADVQFAGTGTIAGTARASNGAPLQFGSVAFTNSDWGSPAVAINVPVAGDGTYEVADAPAGNFSLKLTVPADVRVGATSDAIEGGETRQLDIQLENAGSVRATVLEPGGVAPAVGSDIRVTAKRANNSSTTLYGHTNTQGVFQIDNVPLGTISVSITDTNTGGVASASGQLATNGQTLDLGTIYVDNEPIAVESVTPTNGQAGVGRDSNVVVRFSEPVQASTLYVYLKKGTQTVYSHLTLSSDGREATLDPNAALDANTVYTVLVLKSVRDLTNHQMGTDFTATFTTTDDAGPVVIGISPANNAIEVPVDVPVSVTFNEPIDPAQNLGDIVHVTSGAAPGTPVAGTPVLDGTGRNITFTPDGGFAQSTQYTVVINGQRDTGGNVQAAPFTVSFITIDRVAPTITLAIDGQTVEDTTPQVKAELRDDASGVDIATASIRLDGAIVSSGTGVGSGYYSIYHNPQTALAVGLHTVVVHVLDKAGNVADYTGSFRIDDAAPTISSFTIDGVTAVDGMSATHSLRPVFAASYSDSGGIKTSATKLLFGEGTAAPTQVAATVTGSTLTWQPAANLATGPYTVQLIVVDNLNNQSTSGLIHFDLNPGAPDIQSVTPSSGSQHGGSTVTLGGTNLLYSTNATPQVYVGGYPAQVAASPAPTNTSVTIVTPPGAPGAAHVEVRNDHGNGILAGGYTYTSDTKTPYAVEPDTLLLWRYDEQSGSTAYDSGPLSLNGSVSGTVVPGRFGLARQHPTTSAPVSPRLEIRETGQLTAELWAKTAGVSTNQVLVAKYDGSTSTTGIEYRIQLKQNNDLVAEVYDAGGGPVWQVTMPASAYNIANNEWHQIAMTVNTQDSVLALYVDGVQRAISTTKPSAGFAPKVVANTVIRTKKESSTATPVFIDEVRISSTAHTAETIAATYGGTETNPAPSIAKAWPRIVQRGQETVVVLTGYNLSNTTADLVDVTGNTIPSTAIVVASSATTATVKVTVDASVELGPCVLRVANAQGVGTTDLEIGELQPGIVAADTVMMWHMDEASGSNIYDAGPLSLDSAYSASTIVPGRYGNGRYNARFSSPNSSALSITTTGQLTAEFWLNTPRQSSNTFILLQNSGYNDASALGYEYEIVLQKSGELTAIVYDANGGPSWTVAVPETVCDVDNSQWHQIAMTVDTTASVLALYVDGEERARSDVKPSPTFTPNVRSKIGKINTLVCGNSTTSPLTIDELRMSSTAHTAEQIRADYGGTNDTAIVSVAPGQAERDSAAVQTTTVVAAGYNLAGVTAARIERDGVVVSGTSVDVEPGATYSHVTASVSVDPSAALGDAEIVLTTPGHPDVRAPFQIIQPKAYSLETDSVMLWHLDEPSVGTAIDAGPYSIDGDHYSTVVVDGRFQKARMRGRLTAESDSANLAIGTTGQLSVEFWLKTPKLTSNQVLIANTDVSNTTANREYQLTLQTSGDFVAEISDANGGAVWTATMPGSAIDLDDDRWHQVALTVDVAGDALVLYVDGAERARSQKPSASFAPKTVASTAFKMRPSATYSETLTLSYDDIRVSSTAHTAAKIRNDWIGVVPAGRLDPGDEARLRPAPNPPQGLAQSGPASVPAITPIIRGYAEFSTRFLPGGTR